jgi:hypothetical protein
MKYGLRIICAAITFAIGVGAFFFWLRICESTHSALDNRIPVADVKGEVTLRFIGCAKNRAVFLLDNGTDHRIFAKVQRADFWKEFKEANLEFGVHLVQYKSPEAESFIDVGPMFDAVQPFQPIMSQETVRYGIDLWEGSGEYRVKVPYMEDAEVVRRLDEEFPEFLKHEIERVRASWKEVSADVVTNTCH